MFSVQRSDQRSGFYDTILNNSVLYVYFHNHSVLELPNRDVIFRFVTAYHLLAHNSLEDYSLFDTMPVYCPKEHMCLL
jgi:hypothetical protein